MTRAFLKAYSAVFLAVGLLFVFGERHVLGLIDLASALSGCAGLSPGGPTLWLGLTGSLMAVISLLALRLSVEPGSSAAWNGLLLSKFVSSALFILFAARTGNHVFLGAAAVDGVICVHLFFLRSAGERGLDSLSPRLARAARPYYEVWFTRVNDLRTGRAFWARYSIFERAGKREAACWAIFFDPQGAGVVTRRWTGPGCVDSDGWIFQLKDSGIRPGNLVGSGMDVSWDLRWRPGPCPSFSMVPSWLRASGAAQSGYESVAPLAVFDGWAMVGGRRWSFEQAMGSVGHVWGERFGRGWWWAHAFFGAAQESAVAFEILSASGPLGLRATSACLWWRGMVHESTDPLRLLLNSSWREGDTWHFEAAAGDVRVSGRCRPGLSAVLDYEDPYGARRVCRNSKLSSLSLRITRCGVVEELETQSAAVEFVEAAP